MGFNYPRCKLGGIEDGGLSALTDHLCAHFTLIARPMQVTGRPQANPTTRHAGCGLVRITVHPETRFVSVGIFRTYMFSCPTMISGLVCIIFSVVFLRISRTPIRSPKIRTTAMVIVPALA